MSHRPSPSTSPRATPEPFRRIWFCAAVLSERWLVNEIPVCEDGSRVKPDLPDMETGSCAVRKSRPDCQSWAVRTAWNNRKADQLKGMLLICAERIRGWEERTFLQRIRVDAE